MGNESRPAGAASELIAASKSIVTQPAGISAEPRQPTFQPMPDLTTEQYEALKADIVIHGIVVPIVVDQYDRVLDGHNRIRIAAALNIECPREIHHVADDDEAANLAVTLNCARRHLNREQVREVIAGELQRRPGDSDRAIARRVGCSPSTVGAVRDPQVSNLDTLSPAEAEQLAEAEEVIAQGLKVMSKGDARQLTEDIKQTIRDGFAAMKSLTIEALSNAIPAAEIIAALVARMRSGEIGVDELVNNIMRDTIFMPMIDQLLDPATAESWRPDWDHETFLPLPEDDRANLLSSISGAR
jgi:ParB-like chromosome segregation protein Spo0J